MSVYIVPQQEGPRFDSRAGQALLCRVCMISLVSPINIKTCATWWWLLTVNLVMVQNTISYVILYITETMRKKSKFGPPLNSSAICQCAYFCTCFLGKLNINISTVHFLQFVNNSHPSLSPQPILAIDISQQFIQADSSLCG